MQTESGSGLGACYNDRVKRVLPLLLAVAGCSERSLMPCVHDGQVFGDAPFAPPDLALADLTPRPLPEFCLEVIVVDELTNMLSDFRPETLAFHDIGVLKCATFDPTATPFSMALGRDGNAWVLYSDGELFRVDVKTAVCQATRFTSGQMGFVTFGMGFVSDAPGSNLETMYIAGTANMQLASIDLPTLHVHPVGGLPGIPELTGTGDAELWGFFPAAGSTFVAQIDKATAATSNKIDIATLVGDPAAWAFAHFGGSFWIFLQRQGEDSTSVYNVTRDGMFSTALSNTGRHIVGAGVSTCAPTGMD